MIDLTNPEILQALKDRAQEAVVSDQGRDAFVFIRNMAGFLAGPEGQKLAANPEMLAGYKNLADRLSLVALPALTEKEVVELFGHKLLVGLREDNLDLVEKLRGHLLTIPAFASRDELRKQLRESLLANQERLGTETINLANVKVAPSLSNWLKKYNNLFGMGSVNPIGRNQFLSSDVEVMRLPEADKNSLRKLIELYEYLKLSSQTPEGLEDPVIFDFDGKLKRLNRGEFEDIVLDGRVQQIVDDIFKIYDTKEGIAASATVTAGTSNLNMHQSLALAGQIFTATLGDRQTVFNDLDSSLNNSDKDRVLGNLILIAQLRTLDDLLADERFAALVREDLKKSGQNDKVDELRLSPTAPHFVARFLKIVLQDKLGLAEADALEFGRRVAKILAMEGEKYASLVMEDGKGGKWNL